MNPVFLIMILAFAAVIWGLAMLCVTLIFPILKYKYRKIRDQYKELNEEFEKKYEKEKENER